MGLRLGSHPPLTYFVELRACELRRTLLLGNSVNKPRADVVEPGGWHHTPEVTIVIERVDGSYLASVSPPHGQRWTATEPVSLHSLIVKLQDLGCHQTDIGDALSEADPDWQLRLDT